MRTNLRTPDFEAKITIPCHWNREVIDQILSQETTNKARIVEVYGVLAEGGPVGHGRSSESVVRVTREDAVGFRGFLHDKNLAFNYLLNAPFRFDGGDDQRQALDDYLSWILGDLKPDSITITSHELMQYVRQVDADIPIRISTIAAIKNVTDLEKYLDVVPNRIVPHHDVGKDWKSLRELVMFGKTHGIDVELMATESCLLHCSRRQGHYEYLAHGKKDAPFHTTCNAEKLTHPREFLLAGGVIRPEDLSFYEEMGVEYFKISGRSKPAEWLVEVAQAYQKREYDGNLVRLLGIDPSMKAEDWIYIRNKSLDGFLGSFPQNGDYEAQKAYCDDWIARLHDNGSFKLLDGSQYRREGNALVLETTGEKAIPIITRELGR